MEASPSLKSSLKPSRESTPQNDPDKALFTHWQATGDKADFEEIERRHWQALSRYARRHLPPALAADADDMAQETFTRLFNQRCDLAPDSHLGGLLYRITQNVCKQHIQHASRKQRDYRRTCPLVIEAGVIDPKRDPCAREVEAADARVQVDKAMKVLSAAEEQAMRTVYLEDHTESSAAEALGLLPSTLHGRIQTAKRTIRETVTID
jgi:RNA polymerase sigma-70 factor (ECF subfamily)